MGCGSSFAIVEAPEKPKKKKKDKKPILPIGPDGTVLVADDPAVIEITMILAEAADLFDQDLIEQSIECTRRAEVHFSHLTENDGGLYAMLTKSRIAQCHQKQRHWREARADYIQVFHLAGTIAKEKLRGSYLTLSHLAEAAVGCAQCHLAMSRGETDLSPVETVVAKTVNVADAAALNQEELMMLEAYDPAAASSIRQQAAAVANADAKGVVDGLDQPGVQAMSKQDHEKAAETILLRGVTLIEEYHSRRSDLLVHPFELLSEIYNTRGMTEMCELTLRRQLGVMLGLFGPHDADYKRAQQRIEAFVVERERRSREKAATTISKTWRMRREMGRLAQRLGRKKLTRHTLSKFGGECCAKTGVIDVVQEALSVHKRRHDTLVAAKEGTASSAAHAAEAAQAAAQAHEAAVQA